MSQQRQQPAAGRTAPKTNLYATAVDIPEESRIPVIQELNQVLADTTDLQSQAKFAHWNVKGTDFYQLHLLFDEIAETLTEHVDLVAERITALGGQAMGTTRIAAGTSRLPEPPANAVDESAYLEWLTDHVAHHANGLRRAIERAAELGDEDTADLFTELSREVDEQLYFLEAHLQSEVRDRVPAVVGQPMAAGAHGGQSPAGRTAGAQGSRGSRIEIEQGGGSASGSRSADQELGAPQDAIRVMDAPMGAGPQVPQDVAEPMGAPSGIPQGASQPPGQFEAAPQSVPSPQGGGQQPLAQRGQPEQTGGQREMSPEATQQEPGQPPGGPRETGQPVGTLRQGSKQFGSPQGAGQPGSRAGQSTEIHGGAPAHEAATRMLQESPEFPQPQGFPESPDVQQPRAAPQQEFGQQPRGGPQW